MAAGKDGTYRFLVWAALATFVLVVAATVHHYLFRGGEEGNMEYRRGNLRLEDGQYVEAIGQFDTVLLEFPSHAPSHLGRALALMALGNEVESLEALDTAIAIAPTFAVAYANRGILYDRTGRHQAALKDYRMALDLDATVAEGPGWITRFFRLQYERPPSIADRAAYLEAELRKPASERNLFDPEDDAKQRMYKVTGLLDDEG